MWFKHHQPRTLWQLTDNFLAAQTVRTSSSVFASPKYRPSITAAEFSEHPKDKSFVLWQLQPPPHNQILLSLNNQDQKKTKQIQLYNRRIPRNKHFVAGRNSQNRAQRIPEISLNPSFSGKIHPSKAKWVCSEENPCARFLRFASICSQ